MISLLEAYFDQDNYNNPNNGPVMPCCGKKYSFSYHRMRYQKRNPRLEYSEDGNISHDPTSRNSTYVEYNNLREMIRQAKEDGLNHVHWKMSVAVSEEIRKDGYIDHNNGLDVISWEPVKKSVKKSKWFHWFD